MFRSLLAVVAFGAALTAAAPVASAPHHCPPGHAKKGWCSPSQVGRLPPGLEARTWDDWRRHGLRTPGRGERYVLVDRDVYLILDATREVLEAVGAVDRLPR
jgi:hypothetical protein